MPKIGKTRARRPKDTLAVGRVVRPHGVRGAMLVEPYSAAMGELQAGTKIYLGTEHDPAVVARLQTQPKGYLLSVNECRNRDAAERWRGVEVRVSLDDVPPLPQGTYFHRDILGLAVFGLEGPALGQVVEILETGANDVYVVRGPEQKEILLPAIASVIREIDLGAGRMIVDIPPGLRD